MQKGTQSAAGGKYSPLYKYRPALSSEIGKYAIQHSVAAAVQGEQDNVFNRFWHLVYDGMLSDEN